MNNKALNITSRRSVGAIYGERLKKAGRRLASRVARHLGRRRIEDLLWQPCANPDCQQYFEFRSRAPEDHYILCPDCRPNRRKNVGACSDCGRTFFINPDLHQEPLKCFHPDCY